jgi:hypothetical protein
VSADAFFAIIAGRDKDALIEIRCRDPRNGHIIQEWFPITERERRDRFIARRARRLDVYAGVAPRNARSGGKGAIAHGWCLWVDIDDAAGLERLRAFQPRPNLVVRSGSAENVHAYWSLSEPLSPAWIERANRRLARSGGGHEGG